MTPFSTDSHGRYLSHLLSATHKQRVKREALSSSGAQQKLFFNISAFGKEFHLRLRPNTRLVAPGAVVEWHDETPGVGNVSNSVDGGGAERILHRELLNTDCTFIGDITDVPGASVAINNCDGLVSPLQPLSFLLLHPVKPFHCRSALTLSTLLSWIRSVRNS